MTPKTPKEPCDTWFATDDRALWCRRTGRHITHRDDATGDKFMRTPGGAIITPARKS